MARHVADGALIVAPNRTVRVPLLTAAQFSTHVNQALHFSVFRAARMSTPPGQRWRRKWQLRHHSSCAGASCDWRDDVTIEHT